MENYQNASMDDIIFEGRNKQYGAYELRQNIDRHATIGLLFTVSVFTVLMLVYNADFFHTNHLTPIDQIVTISTTEIVLPEEIVKPKPVVHITPPPTNTIRNTTIVVVPNTTEIPPAAQEDLNKYTASTVTNIDPNLTASINKPIETVNTSIAGTETVIEKPVAINTNVIKSYTEVMPSYKGGKNAMMDYLKNNIRPFESDKENRLVGKVIIRFYVDTDGTVRNPEVLKDNAGGRCAEAAIAAIKNMPKWNPGMQGNSPVKVYFTIPVSFDFSKF